MTPNSGAVFVNDLDNKTTKEKMLRQLIAWAKTIPHFSDLKVDDQVRIQWVFRFLHRVIQQNVNLGLVD